MATGGGNQMEISRKRESYLLSKGVSIDEIPEEEKEETKKALYEYVFRRAENDILLSRDEAKSFHEAHLNSKEGHGSGDSSNAEEAGRKLAELGDQIDAMYSDHFEDIIQLYNDPDQAFNSFSVVLRNVFEWDETGLPTINVGRIAAVLGYCYHLCKRYLVDYLSSYGLLGFLSVLATFLIKFFIKAKFYDWLRGMGGWGQLLQISSGSLINKVVMNPNFFLIVGVASLAIYAFQFFQRR